MQRIFPTTETYEVEVVGGWGGCGEAWIQFRMSHLLFFTVSLEVLDIVFLGVATHTEKQSLETVKILILFVSLKRSDVYLCDTAVKPNRDLTNLFLHYFL